MTTSTKYAQYALAFGGLGVLGLLAGFIFATMFNRAMDNAGRMAVAEYKASQATAAAAFTREVITTHQTIDKEAADDHKEIITLEQMGAANPAVGPRVDLRMRRLYARQVLRDAARGAGGRSTPDTAAVP